jgi:hypothetical protein
MRQEDIPPANEYERGFLIDPRKSESAQMESQIGRIVLVRPFVRRLLNLKLPFTCLKIGSLDDTILLNLLRMPGRVNMYPMSLTDERKEKMEEFCAHKALEPFAEYFSFQPAEPIIGYAFKGSQVTDLVTELLTSVYGAKSDEEFHFALT